MKLIDKNLYADSGKWLYQGNKESRMFWSSVTLANVDNTKYFNECPDAEKLAWEEKYLSKEEPIQETEL